MSGSELQLKLARGRARQELGLVWFLNAGDPTLSICWDLVCALAHADISALELCVPFPNSASDGPVIRASHARALSHGVDLSTTLALARRAREAFGMSIVILADYAHTVAPLGVEAFLDRVAKAQACATLVHGLPATARDRYVSHSRAIGLGRVMSFFATSSAEVRQRAYRESDGFVYVVSRFGRTGSTAAPTGSDTLAEQLRQFRSETLQPLAVGFGIHSEEDVSRLRASGADAVVIGSAGVRLIEQGLAAPDAIVPALNRLVRGLMSACGATHRGARSDEEERGVTP